MTFQEWLRTDNGRMVSFYTQLEALERVWVAAKKDMESGCIYYDLLVRILEADTNGILALARAITVARNAIYHPLYQVPKVVIDQCDVRDADGQHCPNRPVLPRIVRDGHKVLLCESCWQSVMRGAYSLSELGLDKKGQ